jgi:hypothetical protein
MSSNPILFNESSFALRNKPAEARKGFPAWGCYRSRTFANFTREVHDFPNSTVSINVGSSAGWVDLLAGITNVSVGILSGTDFGKQIGVNQIVGTGIFCGVAKTIPPGHGMHAGTILFEGPADALYLNDEVVALLGSVQQITMVEPVDPAKLAQRAFLQECSLSAQLRRLRKLQAGWDGDAAPVISDETGGAAEEIIKQLQRVALSHLAILKTRLGPLPDGSLRFECTESNKELFVTVSNKAIEVQAWQPLDAVESVGYWETDAAGVMEHLEWLVK